MGNISLQATVSGEGEVGRGAIVWPGASMGVRVQGMRFREGYIQE